MNQVGHADSKMTMDVYAQLQQRVDREHGRAFDALVRRARRRLYGPSEPPGEASMGGGLGGGSQMSDLSGTFTPGPKKRKGPASRPFRSGETRTRTGDTTIFSRVLYQLSYLAERRPLG